MTPKKIPLRKCTGCCEMKPKKELIRVVKSPDLTDDDGNITEKGSIFLDITGKKNGRGAYICKNISCLKTAIKTKRLEKSLSSKIPDDIYNELLSSLEDNIKEEIK